MATLFCDGNNDGIGDLKGVLSKLEYIKSLGSDAIWFSPLYVSPQADYGYDIADYKNINPEYGTLDDFKAVLEKAHALGMRVIMDLVINHTSDQHEWFKRVALESSRTPISTFGAKARARTERKCRTTGCPLSPVLHGSTTSKEESFICTFTQRSNPTSITTIPRSEKR